MAAPIIEGDAANFGGTATSADVTLPSGIVSGDLVLLLVANEANNSTVQFADDVTGYTLEAQQGNTSQDAHAAVYSRVADGTTSLESGDISVGYVTSTEWSAIGVRISGADSITATFERGDGGVNQEPLGDPSTFSTVDDESLVITLGSYDGADGTFTPSGTGWPTSIDLGANVNAGTGFVSSCFYVSREMATTGVVPTLTIATGGDGTSYVTVAVSPGGGAAPSASGTPTDQADTATGVATSAAPSSSASGTPADERDTATGVATSVVPASTASGTPTDLRDAAVGSATAAAPGATATGAATDARDTAVGVATSVVPASTATGAPSDMRDTAAGVAISITVYPVASGTPTDQTDTATGVATSVAPASTSSGTPTDERDTATGAATSTAPASTASGAPTDARDTSAGSAVSVSVYPTASGTPTDQTDTATGLAVSIAPDSTATGTPTDLRDTATGTATSVGNPSLVAVTTGRHQVIGIGTPVTVTSINDAHTVVSVAEPHDIYATF